MKTLMESYDKAVTQTVINHPMIAALLFALPNYVDDTVPTAATDGRTRWFSDGWFGGLSAKEKAFVIAHEVLHDGLLHHSRRGDRCPRKWNFACDLVINNLLVKAGLTPAPGAVLNHKGDTFVGKTEEEIYDLLGDDTGDGGMAGDMVTDGNPLTPEEVEAMVAQVKSATIAGSTSCPITAAVTAATVRKLPWFVLLRQHMEAKVEQGRSWDSYCRRELAKSGLMSPVRQSPSIGRIVISIDQSGSIADGILSMFQSHMNDILSDVSPTEITVQYFDTQIARTDVYQPDELPITLGRYAGGGTCFYDICEAAEGYDVHIVLTDMEGSFPDSSNVSTVWVTTTRHDAPFGGVILLPKEQP
jgi:predicted metal-dependent peptidase